MHLIKVSPQKLYFYSLSLKKICTDNPDFVNSHVNGFRLKIIINIAGNELALILRYPIKNYSSVNK